MMHSACSDWKRSTLDESTYTSQAIPRREILNIAEVNCLAQRGQRVLAGNKFMRDKPGEPGGHDTAHHTGPIDLLCIVEFMPAWDAAGMEVTQPLDIVPNR